MTTFLTQYPWIGEFRYKWGLPIVLRSIMLADITRANFKARKSKNDNVKEVKEGNLADFLRGN